MGLRYIISAVLAFVLSAFVQAHAQENHALHHNSYKNWENKNGKGCCNNQHCGELSESDERSDKTTGRVEVRVKGIGVARGMVSWCLVLPHHYLKKGNAPNWSASHVCVADTYGGKTPCEQLICYQPKPDS